MTRRIRMEISEKIVDFEKYCKYCKHKNYPEYTEPCRFCLDTPVNNNSERPIYFEPTDEFKKKDKVQKERKRLESRSRLKRINTM